MTAAQNVLVTVVSPTSVTVTWDPPAEVGAGVIRYRLYLEQVLIKETPHSIRTVTVPVSSVVEPFDVTIETVDADGATTVAVNQSPSYWVKWMGSSGTDSVSWGVMEPAGTILISGFAAADINFGNGTSTLTGQSSFLARFNRAGDCLMAKKMPTGASAGHLAVDSSGNIYVISEFSATTTYGGDTFITNTRTQMALVKYDANGNHLWSRAFQISPGVQGATQQPGGSIRDIALDSNSNPVVCGSFVGEATFDGGATYEGALYSGSHGYVAKFTTAGALLWVELFQSGGDSRMHAMDVDSSDNIIVTGDLNGTGSWPGGPELVPLNVTPKSVFLVKMDEDGGHIWSKIWSSQFSSVLVSELVVDDDDSVYSGGLNFFQINIDGTVITAGGSQNLWWAKLNSAGTLQWARGSSAGNNHTIGMMSIDTSGNLIFGGSFQQHGSFGGSQLVGQGGMIVKYSPAGTHLYSVETPASSFPQRTSGNYTIGALVDGNDWVVMGNFTIESVVDGQTLYPWGARDMFISRRSGITS